MTGFRRWLGRVMRGAILAVVAAFGIVVACIGIGVGYRTVSALVLSVPVFSFRTAVTVVVLGALVSAALKGKSK